MSTFSLFLKFCSCWKCYYLGPIYGLVPKNPGPLMKKEGVLKGKVSDNTAIINAHFTNPTHNAIEAEEKRAQTNFWNAQTSRYEEQRLVATNMCHRTVYLEIMKSISLQSHSDMILLQSYNGLKMGSRYYE